MENIVPCTAETGVSDRYLDQVQRAQRDPEAFWLSQARRLVWHQAPSHASRSDFGGDVRIAWYEDGQLNVAENCLDRHVLNQPDKTALIWEGQEDGQRVELTYRELHAQVCRLANTLRRLGVGKGDRVAIHLPMVAEGVISMLACARIGAIHVVLFGGFSAEGLAERLTDSGAVVVITADVARRGAKTIPSKITMDEALAACGAKCAVRHVLVVPVTGAEVPMQPGRDLSFAAEVAMEMPDCPAEVMDACDPLFLMYTSGSTGRPKGVVHGTGGYLVWASYTHEVVFGAQPTDVFWCTADTSWITGHTYVVYGPLCNGGTVLIYEGLPSWPQPGRWWDVIDRNNVTVFYTSPTVVRAAMREDADVVRSRSLASLRVLGTVGEPISPEAWQWFYDEVGRKCCPVVDTWWQTETGGVMITASAGQVRGKPGAAGLPLPGVEAVLVDAQSQQEVTGVGDGLLCMARSWPGQAMTLWQDHARFRQTYFTTCPGRYFSGDGARREGDGYFWITGRVDDVVNVSGHRIGTAEIEDAVATDAEVVESAAVGVPHDLKGQGLVVFVVPRMEGSLDPAAVRRAIADGVGRYAVPEQIYVVRDLPKTRSGKIVRRLLRKIASHDLSNLGDLSTLSDPDIVEEIIAQVAGQES
ncbi:acetyl-CoA synthetase [Acetobacter ghanensis]|uniref:Acetate--CoA ligase n=1 Tax=Acetobacter ghanensis TaxID=431306 RepID=A0A0U5FWZ8_9PROT|nr:acetate--CoA ligase [Acetobacter ghanensis]GBQ50150.1 acetyl-CoA synthetase [Acetobacter ghanensis DSM 18895]CEF55168.1 acetyl-CoA synthetase [Acetobacter ghanensis]